MAITYKQFLESVKMTLVALVLGTFLLFCGDWVVLLVKIARHDNAFGTVIVHRMMTSALKNGKYTVYGLPAVDETCIHTLFPHQGYTPCWYLERHTEEIQSD